MSRPAIIDFYVHREEWHHTITYFAEIDGNSFLTTRYACSNLIHSSFHL